MFFTAILLELVTIFNEGKKKEIFGGICKWVANKKGGK
tara:strand:+ start:1802 stop:1915 length:114 start_codon:yes stop_codon:yes gene_type:complete